MKRIFFLLLYLLMLACDTDKQILNSPSSLMDQAKQGVKKIVFADSLGSNNIFSMEYYDYNEKNQLIKWTYYFADLENIGQLRVYRYDESGRIANNLFYIRNVYKGLVLWDSIHYVYSGDLIKYANDYAGDRATLRYQFQYEYLGSRIKKISKYNPKDNTIESSTVYRYDGFKVIKEIDYGVDKTVTGFRQHTYKKNVLIQTYKSAPVPMNIYYQYDSEGKLVLEEFYEVDNHNRLFGIKIYTY